MYHQSYFMLKIYYYTTLLLQHFGGNRSCRETLSFTHRSHNKISNKSTKKLITYQHSSITMTTVYTNEPAPSLVVPTLSGETFDLSEQNPDSFTIVVFYRGRHCPICIGQLKEVEASLDQAKKQGMNVIAISMDTKEKAADTATAATASSTDSTENNETDTFSLPVGYGMTEEQARNWGLYMSEGRPDTSEPSIFSEPGMYVIRPDNSVFCAQTQSAPFTRPNFQHLLGGLRYVLENDYPARGTLTRTE